ncbi:FAD-dependent monooxygenase [Streptomyces apocyni]|uniref:FAD-dependent monooxygenase n=1 Tax=Streptomyces apocyni TaxID=2654677 RepID=UPI0018D0D653|nr:FAD-dependent monooxygenase [Streptomyces apocyni]
MKVACVGGGPAALYFSILLKRHASSHDITVYERNPAGATYGWGVTYWPDMLDKLHEHDPESAATIRENSVRWHDGVALVGDQTTVHHGDEGFAIGRHRLLAILAERATSLGVDIRYGQEITDRDQLPGNDLVVAADGAGSRLRESAAQHFGTHTVSGRNHYVWLGTTKVFTSFTFAFVETAHGWIWCYAYGFSDERSTCVVECSPATYSGLGLHEMSQDDALRQLEKIFGALLDGHPLIGRGDVTGPAPWVTFRTLTNQTWSHGDLVLMGDAAHTTHYSIGAGTTLAMQDAMTLARVLHEAPGTAGLERALAQYETERKSALLSVQSAARHSAQWYENLTRYIGLAPPRMFALLGQRHSPLLPYVPPQLYYRIDQAANQLTVLRGLKQWLGPRLARTVQRRSRP